MQIEESEESLISRLLHSIDKSGFGTECIVFDSWGRQKRTIDIIASYLRNAEQKQRSEKSEGRAMEVAMPARLLSIVVDSRKRDSPHVSRNNGHKVNNTSISAGGNNSWKNECRACGCSHQLADCRNVTPSKRRFLLDRLKRSSRFGNRNSHPPPFSN